MTHVWLGMRRAVMGIELGDDGSVVLVTHLLKCPHSDRMDFDARCVNSGTGSIPISC
jgi:hypothetical protein